MSPSQLSSLCHLVLVLSMTQCIVFKGECPVPPPSDTLNFYSPTIILATLHSYVSFGTNATREYPLFALRDFSIGHCKIEYALHATDGIFYMERSLSRGLCPKLQGYINPGLDNSSYLIGYHFANYFLMKSLEAEECIASKIFSHKVHIYLEKFMIIYWICIDDTPREGYHEEGLLIFVQEEINDRHTGMLDPLMNWLKFSQITPYQIRRSPMNNCSYFCPYEVCPFKKGAVMNYTIIAILLTLFIVLLLVMVVSNHRDNRTSRTQIIEMQNRIQAW